MPTGLDIGTPGVISYALANKEESGSDGTLHEGRIGNQDGRCIAEDTERERERERDKWRGVAIVKAEMNGWE